MSGPEHHDGTGPDDGADDGVDGFEREIELIRSLGSDPIEMTDAPPDLWARIAADAGVDLGTQLHLVGVAENEPPAPSTRRRWAEVLIGAAAVIALIVGIGVFAANRSDPAPTELAAAELVPYQGAQVGEAGGQVELIEDGDQLSLRVAMRDLPAPAPGTFYELWLIDPSTGTPVSIATMKDGSSDVTTDVELPADTDTDRYDVVDVSVQVDGAGPAHSGNSVLRGTLA